MAEIRNFGLVRHLRVDPSSFVLLFRKGKVKKAGRGLSFWFLPMSTGIAELPLDDRELDFLFHGRTVDFQDVTAQGVITVRVIAPEIVAHRIDFTVDLARGNYRRQPLDKLALMVTQLAQQQAWEYLSKTTLREALGTGVDEIRRRVREGLTGDEGLSSMGLEVISVRVHSVKPTAELERALETPARERIQQEADQATFERRAMAVQKERSIQEAELQNQIELAHREEQLIAQRGQNENRRVTDEAEAKRIGAEAAGQRMSLEATAKAESVRLVESAQVEAEKARMEVYRELPTSTLLGLAARELAGKLQRIDHLNITPDLLGSQLLQLVEAGTKKLETPAAPSKGR